MTEHSRAGSQRRLMPALLALVLASLGFLLVHAEGRAQDDGRAEDSTELIDPHVFRACADPRDLPFSNEAGEGFENKIAELLARKLGKSVAYTYYPDATGFIRNTLNAHRCDVVLGIAQGDDMVQPTNPYYRTSYVAAFRKGGALEGLDSLSDPRLKSARIGIVAGTPPATFLAVNGLLGHIKSYALVVDTRFDSPTHEMMDDLDKGDIDVALLWGPIAGYYAQKARTPTTVVPLVKEQNGPRMVYRIVMGVRHSDQNWKRNLNKLISENQGEIDAILRSYGVPLLDENNQPHRAWAIVSACRYAIVASAAQSPSVDGGRRRNAARTRLLPQGGISCADARDFERRTRLDHRGSARNLAERLRDLHRRSAAASSSGQSRPRNRLARQASVRHPRQRLVAGHRLWRACANHGDRIFATVSGKRPLPMRIRQSYSTVSAIAGCRGTPQNAPWRSDIAMLTGIRRGPTAGRPPVCPSKDALPSRGHDQNSLDTQSRSA